MVANMIMNLLFVLPLMYFWNIGHMGLALATSLAAYLNAALLLRGLFKAGIYHIQPHWVPFLLRLLLATAMMSIAVGWIVPDTAAWIDWPWQRRAYEISLVCGMGVAIYVGVHWLVGTRFRHLRSPLQP